MSFWPTTLGGWAAVVAAITGTIAAIASYFNRRHIRKIHVVLEREKNDDPNSKCSNT